MTGPFQVAEGIRCLQCGAPSTTVMGGHLVCSSCETTLADWIGDEFRMQYKEEVIGTPEGLRARVSAEVVEWDEWAAKRLAQVQGMPGGTFEQWLDSNRTYRQVLKRCPALRRLKGGRGLDIGGTCTQSVAMLRSGVARLDQVEVSPVSQQLALRNLAASGMEWEGRVFFHTIPAENLPFSDDTFDLVFSLATIHHVKRPDIWREISRVLKPGGSFIMMEPMMSRWLTWLLPIWRRLRGVERGTDLPLSTRDIKSMKFHFQEVSYYPFGFLSAFWLPTLSRVRPFKRWNGRIRIFEYNLGNLFGISYILGHSAWIVATKSPDGTMGRPGIKGD